MLTLVPLLRSVTLIIVRTHQALPCLPPAGRCSVGCKLLSVPVEVGFCIYREMVTEGNPEVPRPAVLAVDGCKQPLTAPLQPLLQQGNCLTAQASALQLRPDEGQVHGGVTLVRVVKLVIEEPHDPSRSEERRVGRERTVRATRDAGRARGAIQ